MQMKISNYKILFLEMFELEMSKGSLIMSVAAVNGVIILIAMAPNWDEKSSRKFFQPRTGTIFDLDNLRDLLFIGSYTRPEAIGLFHLFEDIGEPKNVTDESQEMSPLHRKQLKVDTKS
jgi:hypothetical protein